MNDTIKEFFTDSPPELNNAFMSIYKSDTLVINVENNDRILTNSDKILIDDWIWEHESLLLSETETMDIEVNYIS